MDSTLAKVIGAIIAIVVIAGCIAAGLIYGKP